MAQRPNALWNEETLELPQLIAVTEQMKTTLQSVTTTTQRLRQEQNQLERDAADKVKIAKEKKSRYDKERKEIQGLQRLAVIKQNNLDQLKQQVDVIEAAVVTISTELNAKELAIPDEKKAKEKAEKAATLAETELDANELAIRDAEKEKEKAEREATLAATKSSILVEAHRAIGLKFSEAMKDYFEYDKWSFPDSVILKITAILYVFFDLPLYLSRAKVELIMGYEPHNRGLRYALSIMIDKKMLIGRKHRDGNTRYYLGYVADEILQRYAMPQADIYTNYIAIRINKGQDHIRKRKRVYENRKEGKNSSDNDASDDSTDSHTIDTVNEYNCESCGDGGSLIMCSICDKTYHKHCLDPPLDQVPEGEWYCQECCTDPTGSGGATNASTVTPGTDQKCCGKVRDSSDSSASTRDSAFSVMEPKKLLDNIEYAYTGLSWKVEVFKLFMGCYPEKNLEKKFSHPCGFLKLVDEMDMDKKNLCILLEEDFLLEEDGIPKTDHSENRLVALHHLFCDDQKQLIGFRGPNFNDAVIISLDNLNAPHGCLERGGKALDLYDEAKRVNSIPGYDNLMAAKSVREFMTDNPAHSLSHRKLAKAWGSIDTSIIIDLNLFGQLLEVFGNDTGTTNPEALLCFLKDSKLSEHKLDKLISFVWASASGYNDSNALTKLTKAPMNNECADFRQGYHTFKEQHRDRLLAMPGAPESLEALHLPEDNDNDDRSVPGDLVI